ncbi:MAG: VanZ family protein [Chryseolinea sp.]
MELDAGAQSWAGNNQPEMKIVLKSFLPGCIAFILATILFCLPGNEFPKQNWLAKIHFDKWVHVCLFALLVTLWCLPFISKKKGTSITRIIFITIALLFTLYGVSIEFIQAEFIPFRSFGIDDMVADAIGCGIGYMFSKWQLTRFNHIA